MRVKNNKLYFSGIKAEELAKRYKTPLYVYEERVLEEKSKELLENIPYDKLKIFYACKANTNLEILKFFRRQGLGLETVSQGEVLAGFKAGFKAEDIIYTCDNILEDELKFLIRNKIRINIDSLSQLEEYGKINYGGEVGLRINQGIGAGHHSHCITGGPDSKFGIYFSQLKSAKRLAKKYNLKIVGVHQHIGSGILDESIFLKAMKALLKTAKEFKDLEYIDFGGGFGVPYSPKEKPLNLKTLGKKISSVFEDFCQDYGKRLWMCFEPGRFLVAQAGTLLVQVVEIKKTPFKTFVGVNSGFNHLVRPVMYGAYHCILNASCIKGPKQVVSVAGNICESGDLFAKDRKIVKAKKGDILAILDAGAYGFVQSSNFNSRPKPAEIMVKKNGKVRIIRKRQTWEQSLA
ncbi:diaminopimelate decarboxylase [bacterium]|nr:diaminopimelate decarboxylase [bacterium]